MSRHKNFYLTSKLEYFEYMKMPLSLFPSWIVKQYNLKELAVEGWVYIEMRRPVWGLPQAGILANKRLRGKLAPFGYHECVNTPGLWRHETRAISFTLVVDDFGAKYVKKEDVDHLIASIKSTYSFTEDWTGNMYCKITLEWDYENRHVNISMPGYIKRSCRSTGTSCPKSCRHALTHRSQSNSEQRHKPPFRPTPLQNWTPKASNGSNKLWEAYYIMPRQSI